jgi:hypothetical protein
MEAASGCLAAPQVRGCSERELAIFCKAAGTQARIVRPHGQLQFSSVHRGPMQVSRWCWSRWDGMEP